MKKWIVLCLFAWTNVWAGAVPSQITYQGTLKESGVPVNATRTMQFRLTNANGTAVYWSSGNLPVQVTQGLFAAALSPTGVDWENVLPYIEVAVEGQLLLPREQVTSAAYAQMCGALANSRGMIAMFAGQCPSGWTRFNSLDGRFPLGGSAYGAQGGNASHNHGGTTGPPNAHHPSDAGNNFSSPIGGHTHAVASDSNMPPYITMVFCQRS